MTKVSIIIPAYNAEFFIEECAESVLKQTLKDIEIIFIDDGSTDNTGAILDGIIKDSINDNVQVIHQKNKGLYKTREIGLSLAKGEYVGWVDADDYIEPNMYEVLYNAAIKNQSELVICDYSWTQRDVGIKEKWFREYYGKVDVAFIEQNSQVWNKIVKRDLLERLNIGALFNTCFDEIYIAVLMGAKNPITINTPLYHYRIGNNSMSSAYTDIIHYRGFVEASKELRKVMLTTVKDTYWKDYFDYRVAYYLLATMAVSANSGDREAYEKNKKELLEISPRFNKNQHYWKNLKNNFGSIKAFLFGSVVPKNYNLAHIICKVGLNKPNG